MSKLIELNPRIRENSITTVEISEIIGISHKSVLRKLEGFNQNGKHTEGAIEILSRHNFEPSDFFVASEYTNERGKTYKCYLCTRKGCEFLAHKFTGEKGILFTAQYIKRFHEMEQALKNSKPELNTSGVRMISCSPVPKVSEWYMRNRNRISAICKYADMERKELYHQILTFCSEKYDLNAAKKIYKKERGFTPTYAIDIVGYFPELANMADYYLNCVENSLGMTEEDYDC